MKIISAAGAIMAAFTAVTASEAPPVSNTLSPAKAAAESVDRSNRVVVMRVEDLAAPGARAVIVRRPAGQFTQNFILVTGATSAADMAKAVATLMFSRRTHGAQITREMRAEISPAGSSGGLRPRDLQRATRDLARLPRAQVLSIKGVGRGPAISINTVPVVERVRK